MDLNPVHIFKKLPNPVPSLGVPGLIPPSEVIGVGQQIGQAFKPPGDPSAQNAANVTAAAAAEDARNKKANSSILGLLGRGALDTTILGQARTAATGTTLG